MDNSPSHTAYSSLRALPCSSPLRPSPPVSPPTLASPAATTPATLILPTHASPHVPLLSSAPILFCHPGTLHRLHPFSLCYYLHSMGHPLHLCLNVLLHILHHASLYLLSRDLLPVNLIPLRLHFQRLAKFLCSTLARIGHDSMPPLLRWWTI